MSDTAPLCDAATGTPSRTNVRRVGNAAVQLGPNVLGLAPELKHDLGVSYQVARFIRLTFGLAAAPSNFARADQRLAQDFAPTYPDLQTQLCPSAAVHADETGWKVGGHPAWLWVFTHEQVSLYVLGPHRDHDVVARMLGQDFDGLGTRQSRADPSTIRCGATGHD